MLLVRAEAKNADVDAGPGALFVLVFGWDLLCFRGLVGFEQAFLVGCAEAIGWAAVPNIEFRIALGSSKTGYGFT